MPHIDFNQPPFDVLTLSERQSIRKNTSIRYLEKNEGYQQKSCNTCMWS